MDRPSFDCFSRAVNREWLPHGVMEFRAARGHLLMDRLVLFYTTVLDTMPEDVGRQARQCLESAEHRNVALHSLEGLLREEGRGAGTMAVAIDLEQEVFVNVGMECPQNMREVRKAAEKLMKQLMRVVQVNITSTRCHSALIAYCSIYSNFSEIHRCLIL